MAITIYGAGAIGGFAGACLARAGEDVLLVDKAPEHVKAMSRQGLRISGAAGFSVPVRACRPEEVESPLGLTFLAVKSQDTDAALDVMAPRLGQDGLVVSLQNGMNPPRIAERVGIDRTLGAFVNFGGDWLGPGHIEYSGGGSVYVGELDGRLTDRLDRVHRLLSKVVTAHISFNIYSFLWSKQIDCSLLFAQAVTDETMADIYANRRYQRLLIDLVGEGVAAAQAAGIKLERFDAFDPLKMRPSTEAELAEACAVLDRMAEHARSRVKVRSGPWRDMAVRQRPTEVDYMTGWVVAEGQKRGLEMPLNVRLVSQVKEIERGQRQRGLHNLEELEELRITPRGSVAGKL